MKRLLTSTDLSEINSDIDNNKKPSIIYRTLSTSASTSINIGFDFSALIIFPYYNPNNVISGISPIIITKETTYISGFITPGDARVYGDDNSYVYRTSMSIQSQQISIGPISTDINNQDATNIIIIAFT